MKLNSRRAFMNDVKQKREVIFAIPEHKEFKVVMERRGQIKSNLCDVINKWP